MDALQAIILGTIQGLTEYLPVSSSAHLVFAPYVLGFQIPEKQIFVFDVLVQLGTLIGVFIYFWKDLWQILKEILLGLKAGRPFETPSARLGWFVGVATVPAAVFGLLFKSFVQGVFHSPFATSGFLWVTAFMLWVAEWVQGRSSKEESKISLKIACYVGLAQALALFPGVSRSGSTIAMGILCGLNRVEAARFSFLMSIPALLGASVVVGKDLLQSVDLIEALAWPLACGFLVAAISGYLVIRWFLHYLKKQSLVVFGVYCFLLGSAGFYYFY